MKQQSQRHTAPLYAASQCAAVIFTAAMIFMSAAGASAADGMAGTAAGASAAKGSLELSKPQRIEYFYGNAKYNSSGVLTGEAVYEGGSALDAVMRQLSGFQADDLNKYAGAAGSDSMSLNLVYADKVEGLSLSPSLFLRAKSGTQEGQDFFTEIDLNGRAYFKKNGEYPDAYTAIRTCLTAAGTPSGSLTGALLTDLEKLPSIRNATAQNGRFTLPAHSFTIPFTCEGWLSDWKKNGVNLSVLDMGSPITARQMASTVHADGYTIDVVSVDGTAGQPKAKTYNWEFPPHFYLSDSAIVLYCGSDKKILADLDGLLGKPFAGASVKPKP